MMHQRHIEAGLESFFLIGSRYAHGTAVLNLGPGPDLHAFRRGLIELQWGAWVASAALALNRWDVQKRSPEYNRQVSSLYAESLQGWRFLGKPL